MGILVAVLVAGAVGVVHLRHDSAWRCRHAEAAGYPALEAQARRSLGSVHYELVRTSACEETGRPWATVDAYVEDWRGREVANRYFRDDGWSADGDEPLHSPRGNVLVQNIDVSDPHHFRAAVVASFSQIRG